MTARDGVKAWRGAMMALALAAGSATGAAAQEQAAAAVEPAAAPAPEAAPAAAPEAPAAPAPEPAAAPAPAVAEIAPAPACELHVWPAERISSMTTGWLGGGLLDMAIHAETDKSNATQMANALSSEGQVDALTSLDLVKLLGLAPTKIVTHDTAPEAKTLGSLKTRRAQSESKCYSELYVGMLFYQKAAMYGKTLHTRFIFKDFGASQTNPKQKSRNGSNKLKLFPPEEGEDFQAATDELVSVFKADFVEFTQKIGTSEKPKV